MKKKLVVGMVAALLTCSSGVFASGWSYPEIDLDTGVNNWVQADEHNALCGSGAVQSPINIDPSQTVRGKTPSLRTDYNSVPLNVVNNGHTIQVNYAPGSTMKIGNKTYHLLQFHFHAGSENTVGPDGGDEHRAGMEVHFVHMDSEGGLGVLGVFIEPNGANEALAGILSIGDALEDEGEHDLVDPINAEDLLPSINVNQYYNFPGSLTTPPCSEGVNWYFAKKPVHSSSEQIEAFEHLMHHGGHANYRGTQPRNDRIVTEKGR